MNALLVAVFGAAGAVCRFAVDGGIRGRTASTTPWATFLINVSGSFLLGLVAGMASSHGLPDTARLAAGTGFCGGYTTFSTASFETVRLLEQGERRAALLGGPGSLAATLLAAGAGLALASL